MIETDILQIMNNRLLTLELIVNEIHDTLISNGIIDEIEFDKSMTEKIQKIKQISDTLESELDDSPILPNFFGGPIGEA
jgi:hypothetical protein